MVELSAAMVIAGVDRLCMGMSPRWSRKSAIKSHPRESLMFPITAGKR
jgi:hypothetical protein